MTLRRAILITAGSFLLTTAALLSSAVSAAAVDDGTVVSEPNPYKFAGYMKTERSHFLSAYNGVEDFSCGASLISTRHALTAGHCLQDQSGDRFSPDEVTVTFGQTSRSAGGGETRTASKIHRHPQLNLDNGGGKDEVVAFDVAVVELDDPITTIDPVELPACIAGDDPYAVGIRQTFSVGWGGDSGPFKNEMRRAKNVVQRAPYDASSFSTAQYWHTKSADGTSIAGQVGSGDSGNGLLAQWGDKPVLIGVLHGTYDVPMNPAVWERADYASLRSDFPEVTSSWAPPISPCH